MRFDSLLSDLSGAVQLECVCVTHVDWYLWYRCQHLRNLLRDKLQAIVGDSCDYTSVKLTVFLTHHHHDHTDGLCVVQVHQCHQYQRPGHSLTHSLSHSLTHAYRANVSMVVP
jgi:glyoxylase-like metal-dependent hydrolase (beta-lactamase superfamily II)